MRNGYLIGFSVFILFCALQAHDYNSLESLANVDNDCHLHVLDILTNPEKTISTLRFRCAAIETIIGVMGVTVVTP